MIVFLGILFTLFPYIIFKMYKKLYAKLEYTLAKFPLKDAMEYQTPIHLSVEQGKIPAWLNGIMYRIGPGRFNIRRDDGSEFVIRHAFDGLPFVHRFEINGQTQTLKYNSRMTAKSIEKAIQNSSLKGQIYFGHIDKYDSFFAWLLQVIARFSILFIAKTKPKLPVESSIGVTTTPNFPLPKSEKSGERVLVAKTDANLLQKLHAETLEPEFEFSYTSYDERLQGQLSAAHHQWDPETKEVFNFTLTMAPTPRIVVFSTSESGEVNVLGDIKQRSDGSPVQASYIHSFWLTKNYVILPEAPLVAKKPLDLFFTGSILSTLCWENENPTYFHVFHRDCRGLAASIPIKPNFFTFHTANAFEQNNMLYLDCAVFDNGDIMHQLQSFGQTPTEEFKPSSSKINVNGILHPLKPQEVYGDLVRYQLDIQNQKALKQKLVANLEFPRFNHELALSPYQFVYGCRLYRSEKKTESGSVVKVDLYNNTVKEFFNEGYSCSEPIFVPNPDAKGEDDGVLLTLANSVECCYLMVIDAIEMTEVARILIGQFTAVTFHGSYVDHEFRTISPN